MQTQVRQSTGQRWWTIATIAAVCTLGPISLNLFIFATPWQASLLPVISVWIVALSSHWLYRSNKVGNPPESNHSLDDLKVATLVLDMDGNVIDANQAFAGLVSINPDNIVHTPISRWVKFNPTRVVNQLVLKSQQETNTNTTLASRTSLQTQIGQHIETTVKVALNWDADGDPVSITIGFHNLEQSGTELAQQVNHHQVVAENTSDIVFRVNRHYQITWIDKRSFKLLNLSPDTSIDAEALLLKRLVFDADLNKFRTAVNTTFATQKKQRSNQIRLRKIDDPDYKVVDLKFLPVADNSDTIVVIGNLNTHYLMAIESLKSSEARFARIFHLSPDPIVLMRYSDGVILDCNEGFTKLLGFARDDVIGNSDTDLDLWADPNDRIRILTKIKSGQSTTEEEFTFRNLSRLPVAIEGSIRKIEIEGNSSLLFICKDIRRRRKVENALEKSESKFAQLYDHSPDSIIIMSSESGKVLEVNQTFENVFGYRRSDCLSNTIWKLGLVSDLSAIRDNQEQFFEHGHFDNLSLELTTYSGEPTPCLVSVIAIEMGDKPSAACFIRDVSQLRHTQEELTESEQRFRGAFENAPIGIMLIDTKGKIFQTNRFSQETLEHATDGLMGLHISRLVPHTDRTQLKADLQALLEDRQPTIKAERRLVRDDGLEIWTNFHIALQRSTEGEPLYFILQIADISEVKSNQQRMERLAFYDTLTDLANRRLFHDRLSISLEQSRRNGNKAALLYLDLDHFKRVNDTLGHESGDELLRQVANRLRAQTRPEDTVGRAGGDEFNILLHSIESVNEAATVADRIVTALKEPISLSGHELVVTTSIGITLIPDDGTEPNQLLKNADLAMYRAKDRGRNNYQFFSEDMNTHAENRLRIEYELRNALKNREFVLYYQPKIRLSDSKIVGVESLIRWQHPERGLLGPHEFIDVAEQTGAIVDIGAWIVEDACAAAKLLNEHSDFPIVTAINISARQFRDPNLVQTIRRSLRETKLDSNLLEIEITETMLMGDVETATDTLYQLDELGVSLAIDDFGTGYSSLNYLRKFPIHTVKVDRSFVMDIPHSQDDMSITSAVIAMAHSLNMNVVAEGVETAEQLNFLKAQSCDYAQGFLFSRPVPLETVLNNISANARVLHSQ